MPHPSFSRFGAPRNLSSPRAVLFLVAALTFLGWVALQGWRSHYFLTDDNLSWHLPLDVAAARRFWRGQNVFWEPNLYGGHDLRRDSATISLWNPLAWLVSPLALTPLRFWLLDARIGLQMMAGATVFAALLQRWRALYNPQLSPARIVFLALSFVFCAWNLVVVASWQDYGALTLAAPLALWGLWHPHRKWGVLALIYAVAHGLLAGHPGPWIYFLLGFSFLALGQSFCEKNAEKTLRWGLGALLGVILTLPILWPAAQTFLHAPRAAAMATQSASQFSLPLSVLLLSPFVGSASILSGQPFGIFYLAPVHAYALLASAAGGLILLSLCRKRAFDGPQKILLVLLGLAILLVLRPSWLGEIIAHLPVLRSLRWPFKEVFWIVLALHLLAALRCPALPKIWQKAIVGAGFLAWASSLFLVRAPSFNEMSADREWLLSGQAQAFWNAKKADALFVAPFVPVIERDLLKPPQREKLVFARAGAYNYPALFEVPSLTGYKIPGFNWSAAQSFQRDNDPCGALSPEEFAQFQKRDPKWESWALFRSCRVNLIDFPFIISEGKEKNLG